MPKLKSLSMLRCGPASIEIETRLIAQCPELTWKHCAVGDSFEHRKARKREHALAALAEKQVRRAAQTAERSRELRPLGVEHAMM